MGSDHVFLGAPALLAGEQTSVAISISALSLNLQDVSMVLVGSGPVASGLMEASNRHLV